MALLKLPARWLGACIVSQLTRDLRNCRNKDVRAEALLMVDRLGYHYTGVNGSGHLSFTHPAHDGSVELSWSPRARYWRASHRRRVAKHLSVSVREVESRITGQPVQRLRSRRTGREIRTRGRVPSLVIATVEPESTGEVVPFERPERTSCVGCGRPWLSDLDFTFRPCPACGGQVVAGRAA